MATTVTTKGQVTIPKAVRDLLGIEPGSQVEFRRTSEGAVVLERADGQVAEGRFGRLRGHAGAGLRTQEIMTLVRGAATDF